MTEPIRVVIADDEPAVAEYLRLTLSLEDGAFEVVATVADAGSAVDVVRETEPDVLLLDLHMPGGGAQAAQLVGSMNPSTRVLVFTADADGSELLTLLRSGIGGYLTKTATADEVVEAVRAVAAGRASFVSDITAKAVDELTRRLHAERNDELRGDRQRRRIERAIDSRSFEIDLEPVVDLASGEVRGHDAIVRFTGPARSAEEWFDDAEAVDRRIDLELATARAALERLVTLPAPGWLGIRLSPGTVLSGEVDRLLGDADLSRVVIELSEPAATEDDGFLTITLDRLRSRGLRLAVGDLGDRHASFVQVSQSRPDLLKLDRTVTADVDVDPTKQALAEFVIGFAARAGIDLVVEGIASEPQLEFVRLAGARYGQGPLFRETSARQARNESPVG